MFYQFKIIVSLDINSVIILELRTSSNIISTHIQEWILEELT